MDGAEIGILKETNKVGLSRLLQSQYSMGLETQICLEILSNFPDQALERKLTDQELRALLVLADLTKSHGTRSVPVGLLDSAGCRSGLPSGLEIDSRKEILIRKPRSEQTIEIGEERLDH